MIVEVLKLLLQFERTERLTGKQGRSITRNKQKILILAQTSIVYPCAGDCHLSVFRVFRQRLVVFEDV